MASVEVGRESAKGSDVTIHARIVAIRGGTGLAMSRWILEGEPEPDLHFIDMARFGGPGHAGVRLGAPP